MTAPPPGVALGVGLHHLEDPIDTVILRPGDMVLWWSDGLAESSPRYGQEPWVDAATPVPPKAKLFQEDRLGEAELIRFLHAAVSRATQIRPWPNQTDRVVSQFNLSTFVTTAESAVIAASSL